MKASEHTPFSTSLPIVYKNIICLHVIMLEAIRVSGKVNVNAQRGFIWLYVFVVKTSKQGKEKVWHIFSFIGLKNC